MDLNPFITPFSKFHETVLGALASKQVPIANPYSLETVGKWFHAFVQTKEPSLTVRVPSFDEASQTSYIEYIILANLLFKTLNKPRVSQFEGTALFDLFKYLSGKKNGDLSLPYRTQQKLHVAFGSDTLLSTTRFSPLFRAEQLLAGVHNNAIFDAFHLFSSITKTNLLEWPVLIDLERDLTIFIARAYQLPSQRLLTVTTKTVNFKNDSQLDDYLTAIRGADFTQLIMYKSPYNSTISSVFRTQLGRARHFEVIFNTRLHYFDIKASEVVLRPSEIHAVSESEVQPLLDSVQVVTTDHRKDLYEKLINLKDAWAGFDNRFKTPFPAKWLMCINPDRHVDYWIARYRMDFPAVHDMLLQGVEEIIRELHKLNWPALLKSENARASVIVPNSTLYSEVVTSFRNYCQGLFQRVIDPVELMRGEGITDDIIVLDPFNITMLSNLTHLTKKYKIKIIVPDILYYTHIPYLKYHIARHQFDPAVLGLRSVLDANYKQSETAWHANRKHVLTTIREGSNAYLSSIGVNKDVVIDEREPEVDFIPEGSLEHEISERAGEKEARLKSENVRLILVKTTLGTEYSFNPSTKVLFRDLGYLLTGSAALLEPGMQFIPLGEITTDLDRQTLVNKLASMPQQALSWKEQLKERSTSVTHLYNLLQKQGLSISLNRFSQNWQENDYNQLTGEFHLPRSYKDWTIVCQYLNIVEIERAWDCHRCRANQNAIKRAYTQILQLLSDYETFGVNTDDHILEQVTAIFQAETGMSDVDPDQERLAHARSVVRSITANLALHEISTVKQISNG